MGQSSNDVFPSAVHLAALDAVDERPPARRSTTLARRSPRKADEFADVVKTGRTHLMDAVPVTLGQEFGGYAAQVREGPLASRPRSAPRPDPARRHRDRHRAQHPPRVRRACRATACGAPPASRSRRRPTRSSRRPPATASSRRRARCKTRRRLAHQDRQRHPLDGVGPAHGPGRDPAPRAPEGLVDHAGQGEPGDPRGRLPGLGPGDRQRRGDHHRRDAGQLRAERADPADGAKPAPVDRATRRREQALRRALRRAGSRPTASRTSTTPRCR